MTCWTGATVYARTLRAYGYRVVHAATSVAAYEIAITSGTDVVVTDVHIAGSMSGLELTRRLRIHTRTTTVPIIVLTSVSRPQDGNVALKAGASMFLEIPVPAVVLRDQVARLLDESATPSRYTSSQDTSSLAQRTAVAQRASWESVMDPPGSGHNARKLLADGERHGTVNRHCPQCLDTIGISGAVADSVDTNADGDQSRSPRTIAVRVRLVLYQSGVRVL